MSAYSHSDTSMHINQSAPPPPNVTYDTNYQCDPHNADAQACGNIGITYWRNSSSAGNGRTYTIPKDDGTGTNSVTISFTGTQPQCFASKDSCIIYFNPIVLSPGDQSDVQLTYTLNGGSSQHLCHVSGIVAHGASQGYDLAPAIGYDDTGLNTLVITNHSKNASVELIDFQVVRTYRMYALCPPCSPASSIPGNGNLDDLRLDFPCNLQQGGGRSFSQHHDKKHLENWLAPYSSFTWDFDWSLDWTLEEGNRFNYVRGLICLFNFNQIVLDLNSQPDEDICLTASLNGSPFATYWLGKTPGNSSFPSYDLMMSSAYNDTGPNQITLTNNGKVSVQMIDDPEGGIDIYRIYETNSVIQHTIAASADFGGSISPSGTVCVDKGANQGFTVTADPGCDIRDIVITTGGTEERLGPQASPYTYTFYNVQADHTIWAEFNWPGIPIMLQVQGVAVTPAPVTFVVDGNSYAPDSTLYLQEGSHTFSVDQNTSDVYGNYTFAYFDVLDGGANHKYYVYENPATINVDAATGFVIATYTRDPS